MCVPQIEELRDRLWAICDTKLEENTKLHGELTNKDIQKQTAVALSQGLSALVQVWFLLLHHPAVVLALHAERCKRSL